MKMYITEDECQQTSKETDVVVCGDVMSASSLENLIRASRSVHLTFTWLDLSVLEELVRTYDTFSYSLDVDFGWRCESDGSLIRNVTND
jgi:hypothetical protein